MPSQEVYEAELNEVYVKQSGDNSNSGTSIGQEKKSLNSAYNLLGDNACNIYVVYDEIPLVAEEIEFSKNQGITIEGTKSDGSGNTEVTIDCNVSVQHSLFSFTKPVEFKYLAFRFSATEHKWSGLICETLSGSSLAINFCRFARVGAQSQGGITSNGDGNKPVADYLVKTYNGKIVMNSVSCTDEASFMTFSGPLFDFNEPKEVTLNGVEISKVNILDGAVLEIIKHYQNMSEVSIEGLNIQNVNTAKGTTAGLRLECKCEGSTVSIGRSRKCTFKSCSAPNGYSGAIYLEMKQTMSHLKLPAAHNLDIDSSNTVNTTSRSVFIIAPDIEEFLEQEGAIEFAFDYNESAVGWIIAKKDFISDPVDVYEKYVKVKQDLAKMKKTLKIIAIVVPIVVVVVAVIVVVVVVVIVRKRKSKVDYSFLYWVIF
ncbi:uncharacterized protein MONOS_1860 [Monocercomonoides exilis]|uniref:uncharacterized protein n=1 Tax=Monocercomonoides exilis TaxID=2049356 RepID=UPI00355A632A|nr:hypothetical protein MONOS_1860 [Monocercomonoides exilis]|eukprot:MONOS_1860.1-p1 / transcript=MONOS_1860.1 / gene=MONOS_1860 / organism=Monocercomonoides_exilis_PA203 / gene_product=unspecified product / transcript_product=unspecified product / location=Mono_scaffold00035:63293-64887(-) / protein_length=428 / sequence_SO=supercontig / SO=protein_coding / is_pseudo=false